jgi:hypothetical protein
VEDEVERLCVVGQSELGGGHLLTLREDVGTQLDVAGLVDTVHVAERRGEQILAVLAGAERLDGLLEVLRRGVELLVDLGLDAVLLAAHHADLDLQDDLGGGRLLQQLLGDREVLVDRHRRAVPHVRLDERVLALGDALGRYRQQRPDVGVELVLRAVIGVQGDGDRVLLGDDVRELGQRHRAGDHFLDPETRGELGAARRELDDAVAARVGETLQRGVDRLR